jgi:hypothetical protein
LCATVASGHVTCPCVGLKRQLGALALPGLAVSPLHHHHHHHHHHHTPDLKAHPNPHPMQKNTHCVSSLPPPPVLVQLQEAMDRCKQEAVELRERLSVRIKDAAEAEARAMKFEREARLVSEELASLKESLESRVSSVTTKLESTSKTAAVQLVRVGARLSLALDTPLCTTHSVLHPHAPAPVPFACLYVTSQAVLVCPSHRTAACARFGLARLTTRAPSARAGVHGGRAAAAS